MNDVIIKGKGFSGICLAKELERAPDAFLMTLNDDYNERSNLHFEIHEPRHHDVSKLNCMVMVSHFAEKWERNTIKFPFRAIKKHFGQLYLTSTLSYMLAYLALIKMLNKAPVNTLTLVGCDMFVDEEYFHQKPCVEYWIGILVGMGCKIRIPSISYLLKSLNNELYK